MTDAPIPLFLTCPSCNVRHIDEGEFATKPHHTHACQGCGLTWRPAIVHTVGVQFLPGFKNEPTTKQASRPIKVGDRLISIGGSAPYYPPFEATEAHEVDPGAHRVWKHEDGTPIAPYVDPLTPEERSRESHTKHITTGKQSSWCNLCIADDDDVCKFCGITRARFNETNAACSQLIYPHNFLAQPVSDSLTPEERVNARTVECLMRLRTQGPKTYSMRALISGSCLAMLPRELFNEQGCASNVMLEPDLGEPTHEQKVYRARIEGEQHADKLRREAARIKAMTIAQLYETIHSAISYLQVTDQRTANPAFDALRELRERYRDRSEGISAQSLAYDVTIEPDGLPGKLVARLYMHESERERLGELIIAHGKKAKISFAPVPAVPR